LQVACDANAKVRFLQTDWPVATNDLSFFHKTALFLLLTKQQLPHWMHIVTDEAISLGMQWSNFDIIQSTSAKHGKAKGLAESTGLGGPHGTQ
jgi:hypothetical protein